MGILVAENVAVSIKVLEDDDNVGNLAKHLKSLQLQEVPERYLHLNTDGVVPFDKFADLKVIDLSLVVSDRERVVKEIGEAASTLGFLQIVNHNLPLDLVKQHESLANEFFDLASEVKEKVYLGPNKGYSGGLTVAESGQGCLPWREALMVRSNGGPGGALPQWIVNQIWPERSHTQADIWTEYAREVCKISRQMHELIAESLGLRKDYFDDYYTNDDESLPPVAWNNYPANPRPDRVFGVHGHVDPNTLTLLWQDDVGGLQVQGADGEWLGVRPLEGAMVVNVGDMMEAWTNGRYKSAIHRVATNSKRSRKSIAVFMAPDLDKVLISAPDELVDEQHPRKYRPFTGTEFILPNPRTAHLKRGASKLAAFLI